MNMHRSIQGRATGSLLTLVWLMAGCGGTDGGGTGATPGTLRGNLSFLVEGCVTYSGGIGADPSLVDVAAQAAQLPARDGTRPGRLLEDGDEGAEITCSVSGGAPHLIEVSITGNQTNPTNSIRETIGMTLTNGWIDAGGAGEATISIHTGHINYRTAEGTVCPLTTESASADSQFSVGAGRIYARFDCPDLLDPPTAGCTATGAFALEGCDEGD